MATAETFVYGHDGWETVAEGISRKILAYDDALMMVAVRFEAGAVGVLHHHPHRQVTYVAGGRFSAEIDGLKREIGRGDSFFVAPDLPHGVVALEAGLLIDVFTPAREEFVR